MINKSKKVGMIKAVSALFLSLVVVSDIGDVFSAAEDVYNTSDRANKILRHIDDLWRGESSSAVITMRVKTAHYERSMKMDAWSKGKEKSLVRIVTPLKEKGTATLKSNNNIFSYLPRTDRTIRLTSGMMMGSWMGSHFTNDDLVKDSRREDDFISTISYEGLKEGVGGGQPIIEFTLIPKPDAAVVWGKVVLVVVDKKYIPLTEVYFDEDMQVARTITFSDLKMLGGQLRPAVMRVVPADKPGEFTELVYEKLELNIGIKDSFFSIANLKRK